MTRWNLEITSHPIEIRSQRRENPEGITDKLFIEASGETDNGGMGSRGCNCNLSFV